MRQRERPRRVRLGLPSGSVEQEAASCYSDGSEVPGDMDKDLIKSRKSLFSSLSRNVRAESVIRAMEQVPRE